jgi:hypothetical protein
LSEAFLMLRRIDADRFMDTVHRVVQLAMAREGAETTGGYFCVADKHTGTPLLTFVVGQPKVGTGTRHNAQEKCLRISQNPGHISSWQSRDFDNKKYGGGIITSLYIIAYSGDKEHHDEAICVAVAKELGQINVDDALAISVISQNPDWNRYAKFGEGVASSVPTAEELSPEWLRQG